MNKLSLQGAHGTDSHIPIRIFPNYDLAIQYFKEKGVTICGVEIDPTAVDVRTHPFRGDTAIMMGNEVFPPSLSHLLGNRHEREAEGHVRLLRLHPPVRHRHRLPQRERRRLHRHAPLRRLRRVRGGPQTKGLRQVLREPPAPQADHLLEGPREGSLRLRVRASALPGRQRRRRHRTVIVSGRLLRTKQRASSNIKRRNIEQYQC